jgi:hypothetical protein
MRGAEPIRGGQSKYEVGRVILRGANCRANSTAYLNLVSKSNCSTNTQLKRAYSTPSYLRNKAEQKYKKYKTIQL